MKNQYGYNIIKLKIKFKGKEFFGTATHFPKNAPLCEGVEIPTCFDKDGNEGYDFSDGKSFKDFNALIKYIEQYADQVEVCDQ